MEINKFPELTVILPAYKEAENLSLLLPQLIKVLNNIDTETEILVIDSELPLDNTESICKENGVIWLPRKGGNRYGDAIRTGIRASLGKFVIIMDSDGSHNPEFIHQMWNKRFEADIIIASRYIPGGVTENPWILVALSKVLNIVFKIILGLPVYDISDSFRLYRGDLLRSIQPTYANFDILEEILAKIIWLNRGGKTKVIELPFTFEQRKFGKPKRKLIVFGIQFILALFRLWRLRNQRSFKKLNSKV